MVFLVLGIYVYNLFLNNLGHHSISCKVTRNANYMKFFSLLDNEKGMRGLYMCGLYV